METEFVQNEEMICVVCDRLLGGGGGLVYAERYQR